MGRHLLSKDVPLRLLAVLLAVVLWAQATAERNPEDQFSFDGLPVIVEDVPNGTVVTGAARPPVVSLTVRCGRRMAEKLTAAAFSVRVSLEGGRVGAGDYAVTAVLPSGVDLVQISPAVVGVTLEEAAERQVPVEARLVGAAAEGFQAGQWTAEPASARVTGPASAVARVVLALAVGDLDGITADFRETVVLTALDLQGAAVAGVKVAPDRAVITVPVVALPEAESVDVNPVISGRPAAGYSVLRVTASPERVMVRPVPGGRVEFDRLDTLPIDVSGLTADLIVTAPLLVPEGVASTRPDEVEVTVLIGSSRVFERLPVRIRHLASGLSASVDPATVEIVLRGPRPVLDQIDAGSIMVWVDASGRSSGSAMVRVNVDLPDWLEGRAEVFTCRPEDVRLSVDGG